MIIGQYGFNGGAEPNEVDTKHQKIEKWWFSFEVGDGLAKVASSGWYKNHLDAVAVCRVEATKFVAAHGFKVWRDDFGGAK